jgi:hypothetical protein
LKQVFDKIERTSRLKSTLAISSPNEGVDIANAITADSTKRSGNRFGRLAG